MRTLCTVIIPIFVVITVIVVLVINTSKADLLQPGKDESDPTILSVDITAQGKQVVAGTECGGVYSWYINTKKKKQVLPASTLAYHDVLFSPDGKYIACCTWNHDVYIIDAEGYSIIARMKGSGHGPCRLSFSRDGSLLVSCNWERQAYLWHVPSGKQLHVLSGEEGDEILDVVICEKRSCVAGIIKNEREGMDERYGLLRIWDIHTGRVVSEKHVEKGNGSHDFLLSIQNIPGTGMMAIGSNVPGIILYNMEKMQAGLVASKVTIKPFALKVSMDGSVLVARDGNGTIEVFNSHSGHRSARFTHYGGSSAVAIDGRGQVVAYSLFCGDDDGNVATGIAVHDLQKGKIVSIHEL